MQLVITETHGDVHALGHRYAVFHHGREVGMILHTGLPTAQWTLYTRGEAISDGLTHITWRAMPGAQYATYEEACAAAHHVYGA